MARLKEYENLEDKSLFFKGGSTTIHTKSEFETFWNEIINYDNEDNFKFRGCSEAKYKLYTSSQRFWIEKEMSKQDVYYHDFIKTLESKCKTWNNETISNFFDHNNISRNNTIAYLSYMQHYGVPTPLLDFSQKALTGLYFAVENLEFGAASENEIDNYCSFYMVDEANLYLHFTMKNFERQIENDFRGEIDYKKHLIAYPILTITNKNISLNILNNTNIVNQDGMFFYNNSPDMPIEENYLDVIKNMRVDFEEDEYSKLKFHDRFATCWNIHKSLKPFILSKLKSKGLNRGFMYPDNADLRSYSMQATLEEI